MVRKINAQTEAIVNMTKVLFLLSSLAEGGPTNQVYNIISGAGTNFNAIIVTLSKEHTKERRKSFERIGADVVCLDLDGILPLVYNAREVKRTIIAEDPDIVHTHGIRADIFSSTMLTNMHTITTLHTDPRNDYPSLYGTISGQAISRIHLLAVRNLDMQVACSESVASSVESFVPDVNVVRNGVIYEDFRKDRRGEEFRRELGLPIDETIVLFIGSFINRKRPRAVLQGFQSSELTGTLVMIGNGPLHSQCQELADNSILLPGFVNDVRPYLHAADYFISASAAEGLPLAVIEALACGLPVALSSIEPHKEILDIAENAGVLFGSNKPYKIPSALERIREMNYSKSSQAARSIVQDELNAEKMAKGYIELYHKLYNHT